MLFPELLSQLIDITKLPRKDLASMLGYHSSYITKWTSGAMLPTEHGMELLLESMAKAFSEQIVKSGDTESLSSIVEAHVLLTDYDTIYGVVYRLLENAYYDSKNKSNPKRGLPNESRAVFGADAVLKLTLEVIYDVLLNTDEELEFFCTADLSTVRPTLDLTGLNTTVTKKRPIFWHFLMSEETFPTGVFDLKQSLLLLMLQTAPHQANIYKGAADPTEVVFLCKGHFLCHYLLDENGKIYSMVYTEEKNIVSFFLQKTSHLFRNDSLLFHMVENNDFEYMLTNGMPIPSTPVVLSSMFLQGFFLSDMILNRMVDRGAMSESDKAKNLQLLNYYTKVLEKNEVLCIFPLHAYYDFMKYGELQLGAQRLFLDEEERLMYMRRVGLIARTKPNLKLRIFNLGEHAIHRKEIQYSYHSMGHLSFVKRDLAYADMQAPIYQIVTSKLLAKRINDMLLSISEFKPLMVPQEKVIEHLSNL